MLSIFWCFVIVALHDSCNRHTHCSNHRAEISLHRKMQKPYFCGMNFEASGGWYHVWIKMHESVYCVVVLNDIVRCKIGCSMSRHANWQKSPTNTGVLFSQAPGLREFLIAWPATMNLLLRACWYYRSVGWVHRRLAKQKAADVISCYAIVELSWNHPQYLNGSTTEYGKFQSPGWRWFGFFLKALWGFSKLTPIIMKLWRFGYKNDLRIWVLTCLNRNVHILCKYIYYI